MRARKSRFALFALVALALPLGACGTVSRMMLGGSEVVTVPPSPDAKAYGAYLSARLAANRHDIADAARFYRGALKVDPKDTDLLNRAFLYTASAGDMDEAAKLAHRVVAVSPDDRAARLALAVEALANSDYSGAHEQIAKSAGGPFAALTLTLLDAWAAEGEGKTDAALAELKKLPEEGGTQSIAEFHAALMLDLAGRNAAADAAYRAAIEAAGPSPREVDAYGRFLERTGKTAEATMFYTKLAVVGSVAPITAAGLKRIAAHEKPGRLVANPQAGAAEALFGIAASLTDEPDADVAVFYLRLFYLRLALQLEPHLDLARIVLADRFEAIGNYADAVKAFDSVDPSSPYKTTAAIQAAIDETHLDQTAKALATLKGITAADPKNVLAWTALGDVYRSEKHYLEAADAYDQAVKATPVVDKSDWPLFYARAVSYESAKNWPAAERDLQQALKLSPDQPEVLNFLGYSWVDRGENLPAALAMLQKARSLSPEDGYIVDSVGWAYYRLGRYKDAAETLQQAVTLVPGDATINDHYGDALWRVGRRLEARFQWNHALVFGPEPNEKAQLEKKLKYGLTNGNDH